MTILSTERLVKGIRQGLPMAPYAVDERLINAYVDAIKEKGITLDSNAAINLQLFTHLKEPLSFLSEERRKALQCCDLYVLPLPLYMAYCDQTEGKASIVIATGMIDVIANSIMASIVQGLLPKELENFYFLPYRQDMPASELFIHVLFILRYRLYRYGKPLPNIAALLPQELVRDCQMAVNGAILFILMHELGHITLGHLDSDKVRPMRYQAAIDEDLSLEQKQEYEADQFALDSLIPDARIIATYWHANAMDFLAQLELVSGDRSSSHPLAINRSAYSDSLREDWGKTQDVQPRGAHFEELGKRFLDTERHAPRNTNAMLETSQEACLNILEDINVILQKHHGLNIDQLWSSPSPSWLNTPPPAENSPE